LLLARVRAREAQPKRPVASNSASCLAIGGAGEHVSRDGEAFGDWSETVGRPPQEVPLLADLPA